MSARDEISLELMSLHPQKAFRTAALVDKYVEQATKSLQGENDRLRAENEQLRERLAFNGIQVPKIDASTRENK